MDGRMDGRRQNYIPPTLSGDNNVCQSLAYSLQRRVTSCAHFEHVVHDRNLKGDRNSNARHMEEVNHKWQTKSPTFNKITFVDK